MKLKALKSFVYGGGSSASVGEIVDVSDSDAAGLIGRGQAEVYSAPAPESKPEPKPERKSEPEAPEMTDRIEGYKTRKISRRGSK